MRFYHFLPVLLMLNVWQLSFGQPGDSLQTDTIRFTLTSANNIKVQSVLNGEDTLNLMLHTASNSVTLIRSITDGLKSLTWDSVDSTKSWGGENSARRSSVNTLSIGAFEWDSVAIWENEHSGPETDGKFGLNFFKEQWIEINFEEELLVIHPSLPEKANSYEKLAITYERGFVFLRAEIEIGGEEFSHSYLLHSGFGGTVLFDDEFAASTRLGEALKIFDSSELKDAYGNVLKTNKALLPAMKIGSETIREFPVGFFEGAIGRQKMSVMGGEVLKRFNWVLNLEEGCVYIEANKLMGLPFREG
ncbi:MAG: hypothetical protein AAF694_20205 [Bacteroidota bacterium]